MFLQLKFALVKAINLKISLVVYGQKLSFNSGIPLSQSWVGHVVDIKLNQQKPTTIQSTPACIPPKQGA